MTPPFVRVAAPLAAVAVLALIACSAPADGDGAAVSTGERAAASPSAPRAVAKTAPPAPSTAPPASGPDRGRILTLEGLGDLAIGRRVPPGSGFTERGAQASDTCRTVSLPAYPGVYAIVEGGSVRRITVGRGSAVKLVEGIGVGASEGAVRQAFPGFRDSPHHYVEAPAKYLTQPGSDPRLRFEIGSDRRVSLIHAGLMPQLGYVEGCA